jgi:hyaluronoglucosaminidase
MSSLEVIEGFFGPAWSAASRGKLIAFMARHGFGTYFYAPKEDALLRKKWRAAWDDNYRAHLSNLAAQCRAAGVRFGVGLSPYAFGKENSLEEDHKHLAEKLRFLKEAGIDVLGLFFDDMHGHEHIAEWQVGAVKCAVESGMNNIVFCPSYYTDDPLLDRIFGQRPEGYLEALGQGIPAGVDIVWTGPQVISREITADHLAQVAGVLQRKPYIWDNIFADDGPRNCKFLRLNPFSGRDAPAFRAANGWGINPMNQPALSLLVMLAAKKTAVDGIEARVALSAAAHEMLPQKLAELVLHWAPVFDAEGLDQMTAEQKNDAQKSFGALKGEAVADDILSWLAGDYTVGPECLTN